MESIELCLNSSVDFFGMCIVQVSFQGMLCATVYTMSKNYG